MTAPAVTTEAAQLLKRAKELTEPELRKAVDRLAEPVRPVAAYHFGWCDEAGRPVNGDWGKGVRGALVIAAAEALGAGPEQAVAHAASVELVHNFTVVHDDLMDGDRLRRGRPATWAVFGSARAVLAGDALLAAALEVLAHRCPRLSPAAVRELADALLELVAGQGADLAFESRADVGLDECLRMAGGKTAALLAAACALGAVAAGADERRVGLLREFGRHLGLAFQLVDDLLGIWGDSARTGKPVGADIRLRKKSLPVVAALSGGTPAGARLAELYGRAGPLDDAAVSRAAALIEEAGGRRWAQEEADRQRSSALGCLAGAELVPEGAAALASLADLITRRDV
ncbi:polyprenyl synthetase family protein [Streptomyces formicae]|uniref:Octaprenyl diphosphate synthase n=1 Tax=Streptomyces formicae TaxID=1616117 RepID=A0A291Q4V5_9ACTN|nr:polyprenyl synthetase family protein [Streptomyces formicae]ATL26533.1 Octaprenyl diphosphate synthase [Streptomyces formicae]